MARRLDVDADAELNYESPVLRRACLTAILTSGLALVAPPASAQLHWDASAQAGVVKRVLVERPPGSDDAGFGPALQLTGHVALLPLVRVGGYFGHDISPLGGEAAARDLTWGGIRAKLMSPWPRGAARAWLFTGFGFAGVYARSYSRMVQVPTGIGSQTTPADATIQGAGGRFFEVPFGLGASYKLYGGWALVGELTGRVGFAHAGSVYEDPGPLLSIQGRPDNHVLPSGQDRLSVGLTAGIQLDL